MCAGALLALFCRAPAEAKKLNVMTATTDLAALAQEVGGDKISVESMAKGYQDPHFVEAKPSFLLKLRQADLLIVVGLQLEIGWLPPLITQSGNRKIQVGANGYLDASQFAEILDIPTGTVTRAMGDVHPLGNPHYWLDPDNGRRIAKGIAGKFGEMDPADAGYFQQRFQDFDKRLTAAEQKWDAEMKPFRGRKVVTYHNFVPQLRQAFRSECDRLRRAAARHSADPEPHHRTDRADEARELQGHPGGALFRFEDAAIRLAAKPAARSWSVLAVSRRREGGDQLLRALRLRYWFVDKAFQRNTVARRQDTRLTTAIKEMSWRFSRFLLARLWPA